MIQPYVERLNTRYKTGISREHTYRGDLQNLLEELCPGVLVTNEPARIACGAPDYILTRQNIPVGYIEAKDIGLDLRHKKHKEQFDRYRASLSNLIITDYLDFWLYQDGEFVTSIAIASVQNGQIVGNPEHYDEFTNLIRDFSTQVGQTIKSSKKLAKMMAGKARMLANVIERAIMVDEQDSLNLVHESANNTLRQQLDAFRQILIHDINAKEFADIYAQTIAYGMFAARLHDPTLDNFSRQEAAELIPKSNPFLRKLFQYIAGYDLDDRIKWIVDALADIFRATNVAELLKDFGKATQQNDPMIHFYETFLGEYDPKLKKARGVWYTPEPVVNFIVRAVDDVLKTEFGLKDGLADTSKTKVTVNVPTNDKRSKTGYKQTEQEVHKVQILDPATGTGTFLAEVVKHIYRKFEGQQGIWSNYVENQLLPRLNGFEILMASYAMAHLKLDLLLAETGYKPTRDQRFRVYLTNSLEESHPDTGMLWATVLANEANEANHIKRDTPVMVVLGNPPYSGESRNKGPWIMDLMEDYKKEPGGKEKLNERNSKWINDDYVKFMRYGQHFIEANGEGVLAFINPHGYLDNPTFRGMRWHLLKTYDKVYTIDLHGNSKKKEVSPDGTKDENVFDIQQGVSINVLVKTGKKKASELGQVYHYDLYGSREIKYNFLLNNNLEKITWARLNLTPPEYFLTQTDFSNRSEYEEGFLLSDLMKIYGLGICSKRDDIAYQTSKSLLLSILKDYKDLPEEELKHKYHVKKESRDRKVIYAKENIVQFGVREEFILKVEHRPFDTKWTYFTDKSKGFLAYPNYRILKHFANRNNTGLVVPKINKEENCVFITSNIVAHKVCSAYDSNSVFPLYIYPDSESESMFAEQQRKPNLNNKIVTKIANHLGLTFTPEKEDTKGSFAPIDLLDYIYAVLHSPTYRETYKEFLKVDFPRVPYPPDQATFWSLVALGGQLRQLHLLESPTVEQYITTYPESGDNTITRKITKNSPGFELTDAETGLGKVWINDQQYFDRVPAVAWEFYIGGYQPAQKWLKDRQGRTLSFDDILHYQKIIVALTETDRIMQEIDEVGVMW